MLEKMAVQAIIKIIRSSVLTGKSVIQIRHELINSGMPPAKLSYEDRMINDIDREELRDALSHKYFTREE